MTPANRELIAIELDRTGTPDEALGRRLLERARHEIPLAEHDEHEAEEERLALIERGRGAP